MAFSEDVVQGAWFCPVVRGVARRGAARRGAREISPELFQDPP